jgi:2-amino-4-hydroxy-6-hydroxymethyldihydropteridine diphosphokinase
MDLDIVAWNGELVDEGYLNQAYVRVPVDELLAATGRGSA